MQKRRISQRWASGLALILILSLCSCATLQQKWNNATDDERARIILSQSQKSLNTMFTLGKAFVELKPEYLLRWKEKAIPAFDIANKVVAGLIAKGQKGEKLTYIDVAAVIGTKVYDIQALLLSWGVKL